MKLVVPVLVILTGIGLLLTNLHVLPGVNWLWTGLLAVSGLLALGLSGIDRVSVVIGPFLLVAAVMSVLRQTGRLTWDIEIPVLFIVLGVLWAVAAVAPLRTPKWFVPEKRN